MSWELLAPLLLALLLIIVTWRYSVLRARFEAAVEARAARVVEEWRRRAEAELREEFEAWKRSSLEREAKLLFEKWRVEEEKRIREDAVKRSMATILGKVSEQIAPLILFSNYGIEPKDLRFIGSPVDFVAFKGLSRGKLEEIVFVEVKSGRSTSLSEAEKAVRDAVHERRVSWLLIHVPSELEKALPRSP
ncbi:Holliday junction resolvase [Candidatus Geothermarchaeota archaeon ex4572_27]|nr:MAG: Holliday junction resolvase [Candidatus Geothermarchaeota archaeon ex4572_27]